VAWSSREAPLAPPVRHRAVGGVAGDGTAGGFDDSEPAGTAAEFEGTVRTTNTTLQVASSRDGFSSPSGGGELIGCADSGDWEAVPGPECAGAGVSLPNRTEQ